MGKKIIISESQMVDVVINESILDNNKAVKTLVALIYAGTLTLDAVISRIENTPNISEPQKKEIVQQVVDSVKTTNPQETDNKNQQEDEWRLVDDKTIVTVYNAVPEQCNSDVQHTASGYKLHLDDVTKDNVCAMERTFMAKLGLKYGDVIKVEGTYGGKFDGEWRIEDTMNKRFAGQHKVDLLVPSNIRYGGTAPNEYAKIYVKKQEV